jgi:hypothetical protein
VAIVPRHAREHTALTYPELRNRPPSGHAPAFRARELTGPASWGPGGAPGGPSGCAVMLLAAGSELCDELLSLVELAPEPVPPLGRALRERLARVAGVQLADRRYPLPLCGPEPLYGRLPLRLGALTARSRSQPDEFHFPAPLTRCGGRDSAGALGSDGRIREKDSHGNDPRDIPG